MTPPVVTAEGWVLLSSDEVIDHCVAILHAGCSDFFLQKNMFESLNR